MNKCVYLFANSWLDIGHLLPAFVILCLRDCLCLFSKAHSCIKWSVVWGFILQGHIESSIILNMCRYALNFPWPVIIVDKCKHISVLWLVYLLLLEQGILLRLLCSMSPIHFATLGDPILLDHWSLHFWEICCRLCRAHRRWPPPSPVDDRRIILRWIFRKWDVGLWTGSIWLRIGTGGGNLWKR
jgi:hypothetical protein